jgi:hypothetical protein
MIRLGKGERICACSHEQTRHELGTGRCTHGCGCEQFHRRSRGSVQRFAAPPEQSTPAIAVALAAIEKARAALHEAETALRASPGTLRALPAILERKTPAGSVRGERRILIAIAQHPNGVTREQLTVLTGYKRSSRDTYLQRLRASGHIVDADRIRATSQGVAFLGADYERLPIGEALLAHWRERLPPGELVILDELVRAWPSSLNRDWLTDRTGYKRSSRDTYLQRLRARELVQVRDDGSIAASGDLMNGAS